MDSSDTKINDDLDDLMPPPFQFRRESILFGDNPSTKTNNSVLRLWRFLQQTLPPLVTGVSPNNNDDVDKNNPFGAIYNMVLVRIPLLATGFVYTRNLLEGHPVVIDVGAGPTELPPIVFYGFLYLLLRVRRYKGEA